MPLIIGNNSDENILGTSAPDTIEGRGGNDQIRAGDGGDAVSGGDGSDLIFGQGGDDFLYGNDGDDQLDGGVGDDYLDGGYGWDIASYYEDADHGVTVDLNSQGLSQSTGMGSDTLVGIEYVIGTIYNDVITGDSGDNWLWGGGGLATSSYDDTISGGAGNDLIQVSRGNYVLDGGEGNDTLSLWDPYLFLGEGSGGTIDLRLQGTVQQVGAASMLLTGFENVSGSVYDDVIIGDDEWNNLNGDDGDDILIGGAGGDTLFGDGRTWVYGDGFSGPITTSQTIPGDMAYGNDTLEGGLGDDFLVGGGGIDTIRYDHAAGSVQVGLADSGFGFASGADGNDTISSDIENIVASAFDDMLTGNSVANHIYGGDGDDFIDGGAGDDLLSGDGGDDFFAAGLGDDVVAGGAGYDTISFQFAGAATVDLRLQGTAQDTGVGMDILSGIENVVGSGLTDLLIGDSGDNWVSTGVSVIPGANNDTILAQGGNDLVSVDDGDHTLSGGSGVDTLSFELLTSGVTFSLAGQGSDQDTGHGTMLAIAFENISGSFYDDVLTGDGNDNILLGYGGNDILDGGTGNDVLYGDGLITADNNQTGTSGPITLYPDGAPASFAAFSAAIVADSANGGSNDVLIGGKGDDTLYGGWGDDTLTGSQGKDKFVISASSGDDRVTDFSHGDTIYFDELSGVKSFSQLSLKAVGKGTLVTWGTGDSILIEGIKPKQLTASDFDFGSSQALGQSVGAVSDSFAHHDGTGDLLHALGGGFAFSLV